LGRGVLLLLGPRPKVRDKYSWGTVGSSDPLGSTTQPQRHTGLTWFCLLPPPKKTQKNAGRGEIGLSGDFGSGKEWDQQGLRGRHGGT